MSLSNFGIGLVTFDIQNWDSYPIVISQEFFLHFFFLLVRPFLSGRHNDEVIMVLTIFPPMVLKQSSMSISRTLVSYISGVAWRILYHHY